jgi:hypothetical protein
MNVDAMKVSEFRNYGALQTILLDFARFAYLLLHPCGVCDSYATGYGMVEVKNAICGAILIPAFADAILLAGLAPLSPAPSAFPCQAGSQLELVPTSSPAEHQPVWATWRGSERRLWLTGHGERILQSFGPFLPPLPAFLSVLRQSRHELNIQPS